MNSNTNKRLLKKYDAKKREWLHRAGAILLAALAVFLIFRFVIGISVVSGHSMQNTLENGDFVVFTRINSEVKRGQIIAVDLPSGEHYVKRVIGVGGDTIDIRDGKVYVNGEPETDERVLGETWAEDAAFEYPLTVQGGDLFVMGDNREESIDSRFFGSISSRQISGVLHLRFSNWKIQIL